MKKRLWNLLGVGIMTLVIGIGLIQLTSPVVRAEGCPEEPYSGCMCDLIDSISVESGGLTHWYCTYGCYCAGTGGGEYFYIEQTLDFWE